jgi:uncharacterized protein
MNDKIFVGHNFVQNRTEFKNNDVCFNSEDKFQFMKSLISLDENNVLLPSMPEKAMPCMYRTENYYAIDPMGNVYKCLEHLGNPSFAIGNILQKNISITKLVKTVFEDNPFNDTECCNCNVFPICGGACPLDRVKDKGKKEKSCCSFYKTKLSDLLPYLYDLQKI